MRRCQGHDASLDRSAGRHAAGIETAFGIYTVAWRVVFFEMANRGRDWNDVIIVWREANRTNGAMCVSLRRSKNCLSVLVENLSYLNRFIMKVEDW